MALNTRGRVEVAAKAGMTTVMGIAAEGSEGLVRPAGDGCGRWTMRWKLILAKGPGFEKWAGR